MSDSLTRLILRAQGRLAVAEPLLASRYESPDAGGSGRVASEMEEVGETTPAAPPAAPVPPARATDHAPPTAIARPVAPVFDRAAAHGPPPLVLDRATRAAPPDPPLAAASARDADASRAPPAAARPLTHRDVAVTTRPTHDIASAASAEFAATSEAARSNAAPPNRETRHLASAQSALPHTAGSPRAPSARLIAEARPAARVQAAAPPTPSPRSAAPLTAAARDVQISIGVVEVHATPPRTPATRPGASRAPAISLGDFLARRGGRVP